MSFGKALDYLKGWSWLKITREAFTQNRNDIWIELQRPDENSKMTKPYLYMVKWDDRFSIDISCESVLADDWYAIIE